MRERIINHMFRTIFGLSFLAIALLLNSVSAQQPTPPAKVVFEAKPGNVTYDHAAHVKREKADCKTCHDKLFPQSKAPINYKGIAAHNKAEADKTACGACHNAGGRAFATKGGCVKCHVKG